MRSRKVRKEIKKTRNLVGKPGTREEEVKTYGKGNEGRRQKNEEGTENKQKIKDIINKKDKKSCTREDV